MKIFEKDGKVNFVDGANVLVGFDNESCCCENFGYFVSRTIPVRMDECDSANAIDADGFNFDTGFFREVTPSDEYFDSGGMAVFRLTKGTDEIFLALFNSHNGYYSHGFSMAVGGVRIHEGSL